MMDKKPHIKPYIYGMLAGFGAISLSILFFFFIYRFDGFGDAVSTMTGILMPFIYGAVIAYLLKPVCNTIENFLHRIFPQKMHGLALSLIHILGSPMGKSELVDTMVNDALWDACGFNKHMGMTAENVCSNETYQKKYGYSPITREQLDEFSYNSQIKADKAIKDGAFKDEIVPVVIKGKKGDTVFDTDEGPRLTPVEKLGTLKPAFTKDGIVTAGNSSAINDGAAALVVMSEEKAKELGIKPLATWVAGALAGVEPEVMGLGPIAATKKVMAKTGLTVDDMDLIEANEAFAAQSIAVGEALGFNKDKLNVNGGAIALGHPVGASGARILVTLLYAMKHRGAHKGLATLCIGGGMGCATIVEMD